MTRPLPRRIMPNWTLFIYLLLLVTTKSASSSPRGRWVATRPERRLNEPNDGGLLQVLESVWKDAGRTSVQQMTTSCIKTSKSAKGTKSSRRLRRNHAQKQQHEQQTRKLSKSSKSGAASSTKTSESCTDDATVTINCAAIASGSGGTDGAQSTGQVLEFTFEVLPGNDVTRVLTDARDRLQTVFGPLFAGCNLNESRKRRRMQVVNVIFDAPETLQQQACGDNTCVFAVIGTDIYYFGEDPVGFQEQLQQLIDQGLFDGIPGLAGVSIGFRNIAEPSNPSNPPATDTDTDTNTDTDTDTDGTSGGGSGEDGSGSDGNGTGGNGSGEDGTGSGGDDSDTDRNPDGGFVGATNGDRSIPDNGLGAGPAIGIAMGGLLVVFLLMLGRRKRHHHMDDSMTASQMKHRQMTDDEDDIEHDIAVAPDAQLSANITVLSADNPRVAHIVGEPNSVISTWSDNYTDVGSEDDHASESGNEDVFAFHAKEEWCSSPNCELCEMKRQQGLRFVRTTTKSSDEGSGNVAITNDNRDYPAQDTIEL